MWDCPWKWTPRQRRFASTKSCRAAAFFSLFQIFLCRRNLEPIPCWSSSFCFSALDVSICGDNLSPPLCLGLCTHTRFCTCTAKQRKKAAKWFYRLRVRPASLRVQLFAASCDCLLFFLLLFSSSVFYSSLSAQLDLAFYPPLLSYFLRVLWLLFLPSSPFQSKVSFVSIALMHRASLFLLFSSSSSSGGQKGKWGNSIDNSLSRLLQKQEVFLCVL